MREKRERKALLVKLDLRGLKDRRVNLETMVHKGQNKDPLVCKECKARRVHKVIKV